MKIRKNISLLLLAVLCGVLLSGCASSRSALPLTENLQQKPDEIVLYAGIGEAYRFMDKQWQRMPSYDYEFNIVQKRYTDRWETIKEIHRRHPEYDGRAGARDYTLYFAVKKRDAGEGYALEVESSWGRGQGTADKSMKHVRFEFSPENISRFAGFNSYRITQQFRYDEGRILETVELFKQEEAREVPFMMMKEEAGIFLPMKK
jgi:hypothetical protein